MITVMVLNNKREKKDELSTDYFRFIKHLTADKNRFEDSYKKHRRYTNITTKEEFNKKGLLKKESLKLINLNFN